MYNLPLRPNMQNREGEKNPDIWTPERTLITPETLLKSNRSEEAEKRLVIWNEARKNGNLTAIFTCADARITALTLNSMMLRSIAVGGDITPYAELLKSKGIGRIVVITHYDGKMFEPGKAPPGCGGLAEKEKRNGLQDEQQENDGIAGFVKNNIKHHDALIQAYLKASEIALMTPKPVMAAVQDHRTGITLPVAILLNGGKQVTTALPVGSMGEKYSPEEIYGLGKIPSLKKDEVSKEFEVIIQEGEKRASRIKSIYPNLAEIQEVQNPPVVALSTSLRPVSVEYPDIFGRPNTVFRVSVPRAKAGDNHTLKIEDIMPCLDQLEYPITHCLKNQKKSDGAFSGVKIVFIETKDLTKSKDLAQQLRKKPLMQEWLKLPGRQIIVAQTRAGIAQRIEYFTA